MLLRSIRDHMIRTGSHRTLDKEPGRYLEVSLAVKIGRGGGIRTHDPLPPRQMRYQAALRPDCFISKTTSIKIC